MIAVTVETNMVYLVSKQQKYSGGEPRTCPNEIYAALLKKFEPAAREQLKQDQCEWLIQRDTDAAIHANQRWSPFGKAALMEGKALATEASTADLEKQINERT